MRRCRPNNWWGSQAFYLLRSHQTWISVGKYHKWLLRSGNLPLVIFRWDILTSPETNIYFLPIDFTLEETLPEAQRTHAIDSWVISTACFHFSCRDNPRYGVNTLGLLCLWQCLVAMWRYLHWLQICPTDSCIAWDFPIGLNSLVLSWYTSLSANVTSVKCVSEWHPDP